MRSRIQIRHENAKNVKIRKRELYDIFWITAVPPQTENVKLFTGAMPC
jgi:hypothetical protein